MSESVQIDDRHPTTDAGGARQHAPADVAPELHDAEPQRNAGSR